MSMKYFLFCVRRYAGNCAHTVKCQGNVKIFPIGGKFNHMKFEISWRFQGIKNSRLFPVFDSMSL